MNVALITHYFPPEPAAGAIRVNSLAVALANAGHDVTVVTNYPSFPRGRFMTDDRPFFKTEQADKVRVVRHASALLPVPGARVLHWISSAVSSSLYLLTTRKRYDVIVASSPPITLALPAVLGALRHRARLVADIRDVYPDIGIAMGVWKPNSPIVRALEFVARVLYRQADLVVGVTATGLAQIARRGVDPTRLILARNAQERGALPPVQTPRVRRNGFTAIYTGNLGLATDVDVMVSAAALLKDTGITLNIVGDGAQRAHLDERVRNEGLEHVNVFGSLSRAETMTMLADADVSIVPLRKGIEDSVPTKLYDSYAVGCPVIVAADGEAEREGSQLGALHTPAGDAAALAGALRRLAALQENELRELGESGKNRLEKYPDRAGIMAELAGKIGALA